MKTSTVAEMIHWTEAYIDPLPNSFSFQDFEQHPEHRTSFYNLLHAIVSHCFVALAELSPEQWKMVINAVVWGFKHPMRNVADTCTWHAG